MSARRVVDRVVTGVALVAMAGWSLIYAAVGQLLLRPVSTCAGPQHRCNGLVDLGVGIASWAPAVVVVIALIVVMTRARRDRATAPAALIGVAVTVGLQLLGQALVPLGVVAR